MTAQEWPSKLKVSPDKALLTVEFEGGESFELPAEMLRVMSPSAEVQGHSPAERKTVAGKRDVKIAAIRPVGNYAARISFDDGHDTGIFAWSYLHYLGSGREALWAQYLAELDEKGLTR